MKLLHLRNDTSELIHGNQALSQRIVISEVIANSQSIHLNHVLDFLEKHIRVDRSIPSVDSMMTEIFHLNRRPVRLRVHASITDKINVSHELLVLRCVHAHNRFELWIRQSKVHSCQNLSELFRSHFISAISIPILEELLDIDSSCLAELTAK